MDMLPAVESLVQEAVKRLVAEFHPVRIYLFGSHAWGQATDDSDVDLLVVVDELVDTPTRMARHAYRCLRGVIIPMDILFRSSEGFDRSAGEPGSLESEVAQRGELLHG